MADMFNNLGPEESPVLEPSESNNLMNTAPVETFGNLSDCGINVDLILKSIFFGAIFYLLSLPEVYKATGLVGKRVDGVLLPLLYMPSYTTSLFTSSKYLKLISFN